MAARAVVIERRGSMSKVVMLALSFTFGCAPALRPDDAGASDAGWSRADASIPPVSGAFVHSVDDGVVTTVVDATDASVWHALDLETGQEVADGEDGWDLAFSRFRVRTNGGVSGDGGVQIAALEGQSFDALVRAPAEGWTVDRPDGELDDDAEPDNVFNNGERDWYEYEQETHTLTPRDVTYAIATGDGHFYKLRFDAYYDAAGSPAWVRFRWAQIAPPSSSLPDAGPAVGVDGGASDAGTIDVPAGAITVDASDRDAWIYVRVGEGVVSIADPEASTEWDLALRRAAIVTNSGTSGVGAGGARVAIEGGAFEAVTDTGTLGFVADALDESAVSTNEVLDTWFAYDVTTHTLAPHDRVFAIRTATGGYAKLRVWTWADGVFQMSLAPIARAPEIVELDVDASSADAWVHLSLRDGAIVEVTDAASDARWDVAISRTRWRTNGGTSGAGQGGAAETPHETIDALIEVPAAWTADAMIMDGPPGSPMFSGSPALAGWYNYDPTTHTVSPRAIVFAVRTADGHFAKLRVLAYEGGVYRVAVAFAGPSQSSF
jgi:hypothetical protein